MAITTLDGVIAGLLPPQDFMYGTITPEAGGRWHSLLYDAGRPGPGVAPTPGINGEALTTYGGQIPFTNPPGGQNTYLARLEAHGSQSSKLMLYDRLWQNSGIVVTSTAAQSITPVAIPPRDRNGAALGHGVTAWLEVTTATTNGGSIWPITLSYTNQDGTAGRTGTFESFPATAVKGTFTQCYLQAGDTGIRSVQSITLPVSMVSGAVSLVLIRMLSSISWQANVGASSDVVQLGMPRMYDNSVPMLAWLPSQVSGITLNGQIIMAQG